MPPGDGSFSLGSLIIVIKVQPTNPTAPQAKGSAPELAKRDVGMQNSRIRSSRHANSIDGVLASKILSISSLLLSTYSARDACLNPVHGLQFKFCKSLNFATLVFCRLVSLWRKDYRRDLCNPRKNLDGRCCQHCYHSLMLQVRK